MPSLCPSCGTSNPPNAKFCSECGAKIAEPIALKERLAASPTARAEHGAPSAERRLLTVMFCDLVGSTALASRLDPEDFRDVIGAYHRCVTEVITRFGGFVARYLGDGELIYFGYPEAHEDDAERAVRAGLAVLEAMTRLSLLEGYTAQVRIGIATGLVVVGDIVMAGTVPEQDVAGETPSLAARLQAEAEPNGIVIAHGTRKLVGGLFECEDLGTLALKGFAASVQAWRVLRPSAVQSRFRAFHPADLTPLVGREDEIGILLQQWRQAKGGQGQVVMLSGEPGIGKSRLISAVQERIGDELHVFAQFSCSPHHMDSALHPIISHLEQSAQIQAEDMPETRFEKLKVLLGPGADPMEVTVLADLLSVPPAVYGSLSLSPEQKRARTFEALLHHINHLARRGPVLIVYEDVHWIDPSTRELIDLMARHIGHLAALMIVTSRPGFELSGSDLPDMITLTLGGLEQRDGASLVDGISNRTLPPEVVAAVVDRADGVPLFLEELTEAVIEARLGANAPDGISAAPIPPLLPATLHTSLTARLDRLDPLDKQVAQVASVIGREFSYELLSAVAHRADDALRGSLDHLIGSGLIHLREPPPHATYLFKHALVQEAAYGGMLRGVRRTLHARAAKALERLLGRAASADPAVLAHHYAQAGMPGNAVACYLDAARQAIARSAMAEATAQTRKALGLLHNLPEGDERRRTELELQLALGRSLLAVEGEASPRVGAAFARAGELLKEEDGAGRQLDVLQGQFWFRFGRGELLEANAIAERCIGLGESQDDLDARVTGHRYLGVCALFFGHLITGITHLERSLVLSGAAEAETMAHVDRAQVTCRGFLSAALLLRGYPMKALSCSRRALTEAEALADLEELAGALAMDAGNHRDLRDPALVRERADALIALAAEHGFSHWLAEGTLLRGWALAEDGALDEALEHMAKGFTILRTEENSVGMLYWLLTDAEVHGKAGRVEEALALLEEALGAAQANNARWYEAEVHRLRGHLLRRMDQPDPRQIEDCFQTAVAVARGQDARWWELRAATELAEVWLEQGKHRAARDLLDPIYDWFTEGFDTPDLADTKRLLDRLHGGQAD
jgi:class 3 adenylate cyclase/predicted ATPase